MYNFVRTAPVVGSTASVSSLIEEFIDLELLEEAALGNSPERVYAVHHALAPTTVPTDFHPAMPAERRADYWRCQGLAAAAHDHVGGDELDVAWAVLDLVVAQQRLIARIDEVRTQHGCSPAAAERLATLLELGEDCTTRATHWVERAQFNLRRAQLAS